jgi:hypothetical protein
MSRLSTNYEISRSSGVCAATGRALSPGEPCIAALCEQEGEGALPFVRLDYSIEAWREGSRPQHLFSYWRTTVPEPHAKRRVFVDDELLLNVFERLAGDDRPQRSAFRFVIALILMRKKLLRYVGREERVGREIWLLALRVPADSPQPEPFEVVNPRLADDDIRDVTDQLGEILHADLES